MVNDRHTTPELNDATHQSRVLTQRLFLIVEALFRSRFFLSKLLRRILHEFRDLGVGLIRVVCDRSVVSNALLRALRQSLIQFLNEAVGERGIHSRKRGEESFGGSGMIGAHKFYECLS